MTAAPRRTEMVSDLLEAYRRDTAYEPRPHSSWKGTVAELVEALRGDTAYDSYVATRKGVDDSNGGRDGSAARVEPQHNVATDRFNDQSVNFHKQFVNERLLAEVWGHIRATEPYLVRYRGQDVATRPKVNFATATYEGPYVVHSCYRWGQHEEDWSLIEEPPRCILDLCSCVEEHFRLGRGFLNNMMLTYYPHGSDQYLVNHQDKAVDHRSTGDVEDRSPIFNFSFGADRSFVLTALASLHKHRREDMTILQEFVMGHGDLFVLLPEVNKNWAHGVPMDPSAIELRVSLVLRHVSKHWIRRPLEGPTGSWEVCTRNAKGRDGKWKRVRQPRAGEPEDTHQRLAFRRRASVTKIREKARKREGGRQQNSHRAA